MLKKIIVFMSLFFVSLPLMAECKLSGPDSTVTFSFKRKILADPTLPIGSILSTRTLGGAAGAAPMFSDCAASDIYRIVAVPPVSEVIGVKGVRGGTVYETGIPGIGFEFTKVNEGRAGHPVPETLRQVSARSEEGHPSVEQMTVWLIKTGAIDTSKLSADRIMIKFSAGSENSVAKDAVNTRILRLQLDIGPITYRETSCEINVRGGSTVNLQPINLSLLTGMAQGAATGKQKEFTLDMNCPDSSVGTKYIYWFNAITDNSPTNDSVLLNSIAELAGGAKNVGFIIKQGTKPIKFFDSDSYYIAKVNKTQSLSFTADYFKMSNDISTGAVRAMMEVIIQEE